MSNYTTAIEERKSTRDRYLQNMQSKRCFAAAKKIEKDLKGKPVPNITNKDVRYFQHDFSQNFKGDTIFSIDLKSAYANVLKMKHLITDETFNYLSILPKKDRLACVGMLASKKEVYDYKDGLYTYRGEIRNPLSGFFFLAVKGTFEIMSELKAICGNEYLFTWVDCIYFQPNEETMSNCLMYLESANFPYSPEVLTNFSVTNNVNYIRVDYMKDSERKTIHLPIKRNGAGFSKMDIEI